MQHPAHLGNQEYESPLGMLREEHRELHWASESPRVTPHDPQYDTAIQTPHVAIQRLPFIAQILEVPVAQPPATPYHRAIHWTPFDYNSKVHEPPTESRKEMDSKMVLDSVVAFLHPPT